MFIRSGYSAQTRRVRSGTEYHHCRADVLERLRDAPPRLGAQAERRRLVLELLGLDAIELDDVVQRREGAIDRDDLAHPVDRGTIAEVAHRDRAAGVDDAFDLAEVGRRGLVVLFVEAF